MIIIVDYKVGNYFSLINALERCKVKFKVSNDKIDIEKSDTLILPGVGSFRVGMENLKRLNLIDSIKNHFIKNRKILGICLGMQLLLDESEECGFSKGLGIIKGSIKKLPQISKNNDHNLLPNITWSKIEKNQSSKNNFFLNNTSDQSFYYFVHSYYAELKNKKNAISFSYFNDFKFPSIINEENVFGTQFHLEKSGNEGIQILKNFLNK